MTSPSTSGSSGRPEVRIDHRGAYIGAIISAGFGVMWATWGASGLIQLSSALGWIAGALGITLGVVLIVAAVRALRGPVTGSGRSLFASWGYRVLVIAEFAAIPVGSAILGRSGHPEYVVVWIATVVGLHFVGFGRLFWSGFYLVGALLLLGAALGLIVGLAGGSAAAIVAVTALVAAADLLGAAALTLRRVPRR